MDNWDSKYVMKKHNEIILNNGMVPKNLTWIILIPGKSYTICDNIDDTFIKIPTFMDLINVGILMAVYYHPYDESCFILLASLQPVFMIAKYIHCNTYKLENFTTTKFETPLKELKGGILKSFKLGY